MQRAPWEEHAFGSGPFRVTQWRRGDRLILEPNPYFSPRPKLTRIEFLMIPNLNSVVIALRSGEVDLARVASSGFETTESVLASASCDADRQHGMLDVAKPYADADRRRSRAPRDRRCA